MSETKLCTNCSRLKIQLLPNNRSGHIDPGFKISTLKTLCLNQQNCSLCRIFKVALSDPQSFYSRKSMFFQDGNLRTSQSHMPVILKRYTGDRSSSSQGGLNMSRFTVGVGESGFWNTCMNIGLYSPEGSPVILRNDVKGQDILFAPMSPKPCTLIKQWLDKCLLTHNDCSISFKGDRPPDNSGKWAVQARRLVQVMPGNSGKETLKARLVETKHQTLRPYVTLSHCWGPLEKQPIRTVKENLHQHLHEIPWQSLPKTFREACTTCAELDIQYIWIDSLCIVQDDPAEWKAESAIMGQIYEEALFTIAASSALNSTEGLFDVRETIDFVKIPYEGPEGLEDASVYAYIQPPGFQIDDANFPLSSRAWVMQEAVLSRRTVHFTKHGLFWSCSEFSNQEADDMPTPRLDVSDWHVIVPRYSKRNLTYKSDKLQAIQGLANQYAKGRGKSYYYGVFIEDLPASLRWFGGDAVHQKLLRDVCNSIPSWSWASTTGSIEFLYPHVSQEEKFMCRGLRALGSGLLEIEAPVKEIECISGPIPIELHPGFYIEELRNVDLGETAVSSSRQLSAGNRHILQNASKERIGWCIFDEHEAPADKTFFMPIHRQNVRDWWMPPKETAESKLVWGLVLHRRESTSAFERVGYGYIMDTSWIAKQPWEDIILM